MNINFIDSDGLVVAVIDNFYSEKALDDIHLELEFLNNPKIFSMFSNQHFAETEAGGSKQKSNSLFLDDFFVKNREASSILKENRALFSDELCTALEKKNCFFGHIRKCEKDNTLINYYFPGDYYLPHRDTCPLTALTFFNTSNVIGGEFCFPDYDVSISPLHNRVVVFPGCVEHSSAPVQEGVKISMAQFLRY